MIIVTGKDTDRAAYIFVKELDHTERIKSGRSSFTRVYLKNPGLKYEYSMDVKESPEEISRRIKEERHITLPKKEGDAHEK